MSLLQDPDLKIFLIAGAMVAALFLLELVFMAIGVGGGAMEADADADADFAIDADTVDPDALAELAGVEAEDLDLTQSAPPSAGLMGTFLDIIGFRKVPLIMWLCAFCASFASLGLVLQVGMRQVLGFSLPEEMAVAIVLAPAGYVTGQVTRFLAWLIPSDETSSVSETSLARRRGTVTVGTAKRGMPAEVEIYDRHGNAHYLMLEPYLDDEEIAQGTEVVVIRLPGGTLRALALSAD